MDKNFTRWGWKWTNAFNDFYTCCKTNHSGKIYNNGCSIYIYNNLRHIYLVSQRTAHRIVGYFEEEAVISYTEYLNELEAGTIPDQPAPLIAINYWNLPLHATLKDVVRVIRDDEAGHRDVNHKFADLINLKKSKLAYKKNKAREKSVEEKSAEKILN